MDLSLIKWVCILMLARAAKGLQQRSVSFGFRALQPPVEQVKCEIKPSVSWKPFVMFMHEGTGSSWATALLQSHSRIVAGGEHFNEIASEQDAAHECDFWNGDVEETLFGLFENKSEVQALGFKQKYLYSMGYNETLEYAKRVATRSWDDSNQLLGEAYPDVTFNLQSKLISLVKPKIICQTRRNAYDFAISKYFMHHLVEACGPLACNYGSDPATDKCMDAEMNNKWTVALDFFDDLLVQGKRHYLQANLMCDAYKELGYETHMMVYEDMVKDTDAAYRQVQSFLLGGDQYYEAKKEVMITKRSTGSMRDKITNFKDLETHVQGFEGGRYRQDFLESEHN